MAEALTPLNLGGLRIQTVQQKQNYLNMLVYGDPGEGKTVLAGSADEVPEMRPVLIVDVEGGTRSISERNPEVHVVRVLTWKELQKVYDELQSGRTDYRTVVLDSLTEIQKFCHSDDTEILTTKGWLLFSDLDEQDQVAQYDRATEKITFVNPSKIVSFEHTDDMVSINNKSFDLCVTANHRMLVRQANIFVRRADEVCAGQKMPTGGFLDSVGGPSPELARVLVAWAADGITAAGKPKWGLKKEDKKERLRKLLSEAGILFTEKQYDNGQWRLTATADLKSFMPDRLWSWEHLFWSTEAREAVMDELQYWDARSPRPGHVIYNTKLLDNANVIQAIAVTTGWSASVVQDSNSMYRVNLLRRTWRTISPNSIRRVPYNGKVWCVTVPSGFTVTRRNGKVTVTGNSMYQIMEDLVRKEPERDPDIPSVREWGKNIEQIRRLVRGFRDLEMNVIFTALAKGDRNPKTGVTKNKPYLSGKLADEVAGFLDIVGYLYSKVDAVNGEEKTVRRLLTQKTEEYVAKDRTARLPTPVVEEPTMKKLYEYILAP